MRVRDLIKQDYIFNSKLNKKDWRKRRIARAIRFAKYLRDMIRKNFEEFGDIRFIIPKHTDYCYHNGPVTWTADKPHYNPNSCPFWYWIDIPGSYNKDGQINEDVWNRHPGLVAVGQTGIGGCRLLKETDDDMGGWGLLWDEVKQCGINER